MIRIDLTLVVTALLFGPLTGCWPCDGPGENGTYPTYTVDPVFSGQVVAPESWGLESTVYPGPEWSFSGGDPRLCARDGGHGPSCDSLGMDFRVNPRDPKSNRRLFFLMQLKGPPPTTALTLPHPDVAAAFYTEPYAEFVVTSGTVSVAIKKDQFDAAIDVASTTPEGETIAIHNGRFAMLNGRHGTMCVAQ